MLPSNIQLHADLTPWLAQLQTELNAALADLIHVCGAIEEGTYTDGAASRRFGTVNVVIEHAPQLGVHAVERAAHSCFLTGVSKFISFMDKLIANAHMRRNGITIDRNLEGEEQLQEYIKAYAAERIAEVARDTRLTNPKKLDQFPTLSSFARQASLGMFALRRALEHHQGIPGEEIIFPIKRTGIFVDGAEINGLPAHVRGGQQIQVRLLKPSASPETPKSFCDLMTRTSSSSPCG